MNDFAIRAFSKSLCVRWFSATERTKEGKDKGQRDRWADTHRKRERQIDGQTHGERQIDRRTDTQRKRATENDNHMT